MDLIRRGFLTASFAALLALSAGCGGSSPSFSGGAASAKSAPAGDSVASAESSTPSFGGTTPSQGFDSGGAAPSAPPPSATAQQPGTRFDEEAKRSEVAPEPADRPGLGTEWGETRASQITTVPLTRAEPNNPFAMASLFYNDEEGARAMASVAGFRRTSAGANPVAGGALLIGLRDENGSFLSGFVAGEKNYIVGEAGRRYTIVIRNRTQNRIECVVSVDGLDVIDGRAAAFNKRGYLVQPNGELEIDGFRQSADAVAAFRFGSVRGSYANQKHGDTRNVGVIGLAFFHERGTNPFPWTNDEVQRRQDANPFPGQFATPP